MKPNTEQLLRMYQTMVLIRHYEEALEAVYMEGKTPAFSLAAGTLPGELHLASGQEPCAIGVCAHLHPYDVVAAPHRSHHIAIAKGVDLKRMTAEIFGKAAGLSGGRGGHMHLFDTDVKFHSMAIVGETATYASGAALSRKLQNKPGIAVAFFGEATMNQGASHEAMNLAAVWQLPMVFVCEDNGWGVTVAKRVSTAGPSLERRADAYGIPGVLVRDNDPAAVFEAAGTAVERARTGGGPTLLVIETARLSGHFLGDPQTYRPTQEMAAAQALDPIPRLREQLQKQGLLTPARDAEIVEKAKRTVAEVIQFARDSSYPAPEAALEKLFV